MFGYRNPLQCVEFELAQTHHHHPYDEINLNLVEECSNSSHGKGCNNEVGSANNMEELQSFHVINGGIYKKFVHATAIVDIVYSLLRLALHFLELITGGLGLKPRSTYMIYNSGTGPTTTSSPFEEVQLQSAFKISAQVAHEKSSQTLTVAIWSGKFIVCIIQLIVASALYSGTTNMKDSRMSIRNCRIWMWTTVCLNLIILLELCGIFILGRSGEHGLAIVTCLCEFIARSIGFCLVWRFIKQLKFQLCDLEQDEHIIYYELCPSTAANATANGHYNRQSQST